MRVCRWRTAATAVRLSAMLRGINERLGPVWLIASLLAIAALIVLIAAGIGSALSSFAFLYLFFFVIVGVIRLLYAGAKRLWPDRVGPVRSQYAATSEDGPESHALDGAQEIVEPNMAAIWVAAGAAVLAVISVFLPRVESDTFIRVQENTLIQSGDGWLLVGCALGLAGAAYRAYRERTRTWAVLILGIVICGFAVYAGSGDRLKLESAGSVFGEQVTDTASPGVGIYAAGSAGVLAIFAGWSLAGKSGTALEPEPAQQTRTCPECAETVLEEARVCKHCGYRFAPPVSEYPQ